jgi:hypothetical protein
MRTPGNWLGGALVRGVLLLTLVTALPAAAAGGEKTLTGSRIVVPDEAWGARDPAGDRDAMASMKTIDPASAWWSSPVVITLRERNGMVTVVGIRRPEGATNPVRHGGTK